MTQTRDNGSRSTPAFQPVIDQLTQTRDELEAKATEQAARLATTKAELKQVKTSLAALQGSTSKQATADEVYALAAELLLKSPLAREELTQELTKRLTGQGFPGTGIGLRVSRLIKSGQLKETDEGLTLKK